MNRRRFNHREHREHGEKNRDKKKDFRNNEESWNKVIQDNVNAER
jgi:hypothetical protein